MNPTLLEILAFTLAIIIGLTLLLIGARMAVGEAKEEEVIEEDTETQERLDFLRKYSIQMESMLNQQSIGMEEYEAEMDYVNRELDEIEGRNV